MLLCSSRVCVHGAEGKVLSPASCQKWGGVGGGDGALLCILPASALLATVSRSSLLEQQTVTQGIGLRELWLEPSAGAQH